MQHIATKYDTQNGSKIKLICKNESSFADIMKATIQ